MTTQLYNMIKAKQNQQNNAMTEVALALAMAFFCIMVLALISMDTGQESTKIAQEASVSIERPLTAHKSQQQQEPASPNNLEHPQQVLAQNMLVSAYGQFFDSHLQPVTIQQWLPQHKADKPVILAVMPNANIHDIMLMKQQLPAHTQITLITTEWQQALQAYKVQN